MSPTSQPSTRLVVLVRHDEVVPRNLVPISLELPRTYEAVTKLNAEAATVGQSLSQPRRGGMRKPGTVVPGSRKWDEPSPLQRTERGCGKTPTRSDFGKGTSSTRAVTHAKPMRLSAAEVRSCLRGHFLPTPAKRHDPASKLVEIPRLLPECASVAPARGSIPPG
jgi:hypothetical protein